MGTGFKDWATTRELQRKREKEWGQYIKNAQLAAIIQRNLHPQYKFHKTVKDQRNCLCILPSVTRNSRHSQFKNTLYITEPRNSFYTWYNLRSPIFCKDKFDYTGNLTVKL